MADRESLREGTGTDRTAEVRLPEMPSHPGPRRRWSFGGRHGRGSRSLLDQAGPDHALHGWVPRLSGWRSLAAGSQPVVDAGLPQGCERRPGRGCHACSCYRWSAEIWAPFSAMVWSTCALRELYEETGLLLSPAIWTPARLVYAGRWLTPPSGSPEIRQSLLPVWSGRLTRPNSPASLPKKRSIGEWIHPGGGLGSLAKW